MKTRMLIVMAVLSLTATCARANQPQIITWTVDGEQREALVFAPEPATLDIKHPLVFAFHGHSGNMNDASQAMHIQTLWPAAIVVYPQGKHRPGDIDPQGNKTGWQVEANQTWGNVGNKELDFFDTMLAAMHQKFTVDDERVYSTGFSSGAVFSYLLWAERPQIIAAIGETAGRLWDSEHLTQPRALLAIGGSLDTTDIFAKQKATIDNDARPADSATGPGQPCPLPSGAPSLTTCTFYSSTTQTPVKELIHPAAHIYPSWAPPEIVTFFKNHKRP
jgi:polyhydroxybutyrate depolymerase